MARLGGPGFWACLAVMVSLAAGKRAVMKRRLVKAKTATQVARLLDAMSPLRNDKEFNLAISAYGRCGAPEQSIALLWCMRKQGMQPDLLAYNAAMSACGKVGQWQQAQKLFGDMKQSGHVTPDTWTLNALLLAHCRGGQWEDALMLLRSAGGTTEPDEVSYRTVLTGMAAEQEWELALDLLAEMVRSGLTPAIGTYGSVLAASNLPPVQRERQLLRELRERSAPPDQASFLLAAYACKANSAWESVEELLAEHEEAVNERGLRPAEGFYAALIAACGSARQWDLQWNVHCVAKRSGVDMGAVAATNLLHAAAQAGNARRSRALIKELLEGGKGKPDVSYYSAALSACEVGGLSCYAMPLIDRMVSEGLKPDVGCYTAAMQALAAAGELGQGIELLRSMHASLEHSMLAASYPVHRALLEACRAAGDTVRAAEAQSLLERHSIQSLPPIAVATDARVNGPVRRAKKRAASGTVHTNTGEAQLVKGVRRLCERLRRRELYAPRLEALPPDFTRRASTKSQEASLQRHAEKKALVSLLGANASKLELSVNFHMCVDCHAFIKAASVLLQRPIVCREPKMVHHFSGGVCSCGDRWRWEARAVRRTK